MRAIIYVVLICIAITLQQISAQVSTGPNTTNVNDHNPPGCYQTFNQSNYGPDCNCEWVKMNNINLANYPCNYSTLIKVVDDEFNGGTLDLDIWKIGYPWGEDNGGKSYAGMPYGNNVYLSNGYLYLKPKMESLTQGQFGNTYAGPNPLKNFDYTEGTISSIMKWGYGKFEIRCKMADNPTYLNSAFWLMGDCKNEIDAFETFDDDNEGGIFDENPKHEHVNMRIQTGAFSSIGHCNDGGNRRCHREYKTKLPIGQYLNQWHTYTLYWDEYSIQLEIDGVNTGELITSMFKYYPYPSAKLCTDLESNKDYRKMISYPYDFNSRLNLILDVAIRDHSGPDNSLPSSLGNDKITIVDYIKVWQNERCGQVKYLCGQFNNNTDEAIVFGSQINISANGCGWTLLGNSNSLSYFQAIAEDEVAIMPNFNAQAGSNFSAFIKPCEYNARMKAPTLDTLIGNEEISSNLGFEVSPNPNNGKFSVSLPEHVTGKFEIINNLGQSCYEQDIDGSLKDISVSLESISSGFYYVKLYGIHRLYTAKIIINE